MVTDHFIKKRRLLYDGISHIVVFFVLCIWIYAAVIHEAETVWVGKSFYFLTSNTDNVEVGTWESLQKGGAGYVLKYENKDRVVLNVYLKEADCISVQAELSEETQIVPFSVGYLYFKRSTDKKKAEVYCSALENMYDCMQVLEQEIARLEKGATQQSVWRMLSILQKQIQYLGKNYAKKYNAFAEICENAQLCLQKLLQDTLYVKDLRYLLCEMTMGYISLADSFSL